jgi:hypothetical protein
MLHSLLDDSESSTLTIIRSHSNPHPVRLYSCTGQDSLHFCSKYESYTSTAVPVPRYADGHAVLPAAYG